MRVTITGHAGALVETRTERVLIDPVFSDLYASGTMAFHPARSFDLEKMPQLSAILVTHAHLDHFDPPSLKRLPRDVPMLLPADKWLAEQCRALGFTRVTSLADWASYTAGDLTITATPSDFEWDELGALFVADGASYWHMSDCVVKPEVGARIRESYGRISAVSARYQPVQVLPGYMRGLGSSYDERRLVAEWFEAAALTEPYYLFPYSWAVVYVGRYAWANRHLAPWSPEDAARIYRRRLPQTTTELVSPGDILEIAAGGVVRQPAASDWVKAMPTAQEPQLWEPIDVSTLGGVEPERRAELRGSVDALWADEIIPFISHVLSLDDSMFHNYVRWGVVWQCAIHAGDDERLYYALDFRTPGQLAHGRSPHPDANMFVHISGDGLLRVLRGESGTEVFWMSGDVRQYERILYLEDGRVTAPPLEGWALADALPEPITTYLRKFRG